MRAFLRELAIAVAPTVISEVGQTIRQVLSEREERRRAEFDRQFGEAVDKATSDP